MLIELTIETTTVIVVKYLNEHLDIYNKMLEDNKIHHGKISSTGEEFSFIPMYSYDYKEEKKELKKMIKSLKLVIDYYTTI